MGQDWLFSGENYICNLRTVGVLVKNQKLLVQRDRGGAAYALPGGHIKIGERLEQGLTREFREEAGADIQVRQLLWSEECFWEWGGKTVHSIAFYFLIEERDGSEIPDLGVFLPHRDNHNVEIGWLDIDKIQDALIYPEFLKTEVHCLNGPIKHFVSK